MKSSTLCVEELTLESIVLPMHDGGVAGASELPILSTSSPPHHKELPLVDDVSSDATTIQAEDDDDTPRKPVEASTTTAALGFVERLMREYAMKREIHTLIHKKQQQVRQMQILIATYQEQLLKAIGMLDEETQQQRETAEALQKDRRKQLVEVLATGAERELVEATRMLGLVQLQRRRILRERTKLRRTVVTMRQEECDWLLKSIVAQHEQECEALLSAISTKKYLEEGSLQATLAVQITQDDPIFAPVETLFETQPLARQLELQLTSIEKVIATMTQKCEDLEMKNIAPSGPVPLAKRSSFRDRRQDGGYPTSDRKRVVRLHLIQGKHIRSDRTSPDLAERHRKYTSVVLGLSDLLRDTRTRSGRLLHQFVEKLHNDTVIQVRVSTNRQREIDPDSNQNESATIPTSENTDNFLQDRYLIPRLPAYLQSTLREDGGNEADQRGNEPAVDSLKLPPPAMITAFVKFLTRMITTEYELLAASPSTVDEMSDSTDDNVDQSFEDAMDQTVIQDCVHEMLFQRITMVSYASAIDEYHFSHQDDSDASSTQFLFPLHWHHSKAMIQGIAPAELAFPDDTLVAVSAYLEQYGDEIRRHGFLPKTLSLFRRAELETTPKGVVRAVMAGFKMLHREIVSVLSSEKASPTPPGKSSKRRPQRRGFNFFNADILIPSVVLMMSRLPQAECLDQLWHRTLLVEAFRSSALSDGGEEAYYLTCLAAAIEFINTFQSANPEIRDECAACEQIRSDLKKRGVRIERVTGPDAPRSPRSSPPITRGRPPFARTGQGLDAWSKKEHESIKQLSKWISDQPPSDHSTTVDMDKVVPQHELWSHEAFTSIEAGPV